MKQNIVLTMHNVVLEDGRKLDAVILDWVQEMSLAELANVQLQWIMNPHV
jgi:hypothetical protein